MTHVAQLVRRGLLSLVLALTAGACDRADPTEPLTNTKPISDAGASPQALSLASSFHGGIPFGTFHLPKDQYGINYNGSLGNIYPKYLPDYLAAAKRSGTRLILNFASSEDHFLNKDGSFSMELWKKQVDRFRGVDFTSYIADGTIIGHYLVDEPYDPVNWGGKVIPKAVVDEMGKYSKQLWPTLPTIVRAYATWMKGYDWKYVDAAWAQYSARHGPVATFLANNVRDAESAGLALVTGFNQLGGGSSAGLTGFYPGKYAMSAGELESYGTVLLTHGYPCAFISWKWDPNYMGRSDIKSALAKLAQKARSHPSRSCHGRSTEDSPGGSDDDDDDHPSGGGDDDDDHPSGGGGDVADPPSGGGGDVPDPPSGGGGDVPDPPSGGGGDVPDPPSGGGGDVPDPPNGGGGDVTDPPGGGGDDVSESPTPGPSIGLAVTGWQEGKRQHMRLTWSGAAGTRVDVYRNGELRTSTENDGKYTNTRDFSGAATYVYKICENSSSKCSNEATATLPSGGGGNNEPPAGGNEKPPASGSEKPPASGSEKPPASGSEKPPTQASITLKVSGSQQGRQQYMQLTWSGAAGSSVDVYRNGQFRTNTENDKRYTNSREFRGAAKYVYKVCEKGSSRCSNEATVTFR